jgi:hypothetical protein
MGYVNCHPFPLFSIALNQEVLGFRSLAPLIPPSLYPPIPTPSLPMPTPTPEDPDANAEQPHAEWAAMMDIDKWLEQLRQSDRSLYNLMALEVWAIARTMDGLVPGFWTRFMENRQTALRQFVEHRKAHQAIHKDSE